MADGGHFGFFANYKISPHFSEGHPFQFPFKTFEEDKTTEKGTSTLHGHGSSPNDPTINESFVITSAKEVMFLPVFVCLSVCLSVCVCVLAR